MQKTRYSLLKCQWLRHLLSDFAAELVSGSQWACTLLLWISFKSVNKHINCLKSNSYLRISSVFNMMKMRVMHTIISIISPSATRFFLNPSVSLQIGTSVSPIIFVKIGQRFVKLFKNILGGYFLFAQSVYIYIYYSRWLIMLFCLRTWSAGTMTDMLARM